MSRFSSLFSLLSTRYGQAVLALVLIIGGIITVVGLTLASLAISFIGSTSSFEAAEKAQTVSVGGIEDALLRLSRAKGLSGTYTLVGLDAPAAVTVTQDSPSTGLVTITSSSTISRHERRLKAVVSRNATSGEISLVSWETF